MSAEPLPDAPAAFMGSRAFSDEDTKIFFGRSSEIGQVVESWTGRRFTILYGCAGAGKTSLLRAGVMPALRARGEEVLSLGNISHRSAFPIAALPRYDPMSLALLSSWYDREPPVRFSGVTVTDVLRRHCRTDRYGRPVPTFAAIDQAESLVHVPKRHEQSRLRLLDELTTAMAELPALHLLLATREDTLDEAKELATRLGCRDAAVCRLGTLKPEAAVESVITPLRALGRAPDERTARLLVNELRTVRAADGSPAKTVATVDPALLQLVCSRLWDGLAENVEMSAEALGPAIDGMLAEFCARTLAAIAADHSVPAAAVQSWFRDTFGHEQGRAGIPEGSSLPAWLPPGVLLAAQDRHLVRAHRRDGLRRYEVQHPRLQAAIRKLGDPLMPIRRPPADRLGDAEAALSRGDLDLARRHVQAAIRASADDNPRFIAEAESLLGNIAFERGARNDAIAHYRAAAGMFEAIPDHAAVGRLLTAVGRLLLEEEDKQAEAVKELSTAVSRLPNDLQIHTALGRALWRAGRPRAAVAVLDEVLGHGEDSAEALRIRDRIFADLHQHQDD